MGGGGALNPVHYEQAAGCAGKGSGVHQVVQQLAGHAHCQEERRPHGGIRLARHTHHDVLELQRPGRRRSAPCSAMSPHTGAESYRRMYACTCEGCAALGGYSAAVTASTADAGSWNACPKPHNMQSSVLSGLHPIYLISVSTVRAARSPCEGLLLPLSLLPSTHTDRLQTA